MSEPSGPSWALDLSPVRSAFSSILASSPGFFAFYIKPRTRTPVSPRLKTARRNPVNYAPAVAQALGKLRYTLRRTRPYEVMGMKEGTFWGIFDSFSEDLLKALRPTADGRRPTSPEMSSIADDVAMAIRSPGTKELSMENQIRFGFYNRVMQTIFTKKELENHLSMGDFRYPMEWFPQARSIGRVIHLHVGPTNSGKTHNALKRLEESTGLCVYAGPLRLLAQEIYARMNARGKPTWLITGDDRQPPSAKDETNPTSIGISCTVEMVPIHRYYDVAVIDEIQMIADEQRGTAWTNALIGLPAKEVHVCGEERAVDLVKHIARSLGEKLIIHRYKRLSPLDVMDKPLRGLQDLQKGDCVVCFSILQIQKMKIRIEKLTGKKAAIVYGSLPAEIRARQAHLFNDPNNDYDYLVASDAIGMGLNLEIKRVIFETVSKESHAKRHMLTVSEIKQIGGRAGRFKSSFQEQKAFIAASSQPPSELNTDLSEENDVASKLASELIADSETQILSDAEDEQITSAQESDCPDDDNNLLESESDIHTSEHNYANYHPLPNSGEFATDAEIPDPTESVGETSTGSPQLTTEGEALQSTSSGSEQGFLPINTPPPSTKGWVTAFTSQALTRIRGAMKMDASPLRKAGVFPTKDMIELFCSYFPPGIPYGFILARLNEISKLSTRYFLCRMNDTVEIANAIEEVRDLSIEDRILCCYAPVSTRRPREVDTIVEMAHCIANQAGGGLLELKSIDLDLLDRKPIGDQEYLQELELLHKSLVLYNWMSYRFPGVFGQRPLAGQAKSLTEDAINNVLAILSLPEKVAGRPEELTIRYYRGPSVMAIPELARPESETNAEAEKTYLQTERRKTSNFSPLEETSDGDGLYEVIIDRSSPGEKAVTAP